MFYTVLRLIMENNFYISSFQVCMIAMVCCEGARRKAPTNFVFLGVFTGRITFINFICYHESIFKKSHRRQPKQLCILIIVFICSSSGGGLYARIRLCVLSSGCGPYCRRNLRLRYSWINTLCIPSKPVKLIVYI